MKRFNFLGLITDVAFAGFLYRECGWRPETLDSTPFPHQPDADVVTDNGDLQLKKIRDINHGFANDVFITRDRFPVLVSLSSKLKVIQDQVDFVNYLIPGFPDLTGVRHEAWHITVV